VNRTPWMTTVAFVLGALWLLTGVAWAQPSGPANVPQILNVRTFKGVGGDEQRTFLTTDPITFEATLRPQSQLRRGGTGPAPARPGQP